MAKHELGPLLAARVGAGVFVLAGLMWFFLGSDAGTRTAQQTEIISIAHEEGRTVFHLASPKPPPECNPVDVHFFDATSATAPPAEWEPGAQREAELVVTDDGCRLIRYGNVGQ